MNVNYKNLFYIFHPDGKFTEDQLKKILDAAYAEGHKKGYNEGYEVGKNSTFHIGYPYTDWRKSPWYTTTSGDTISVTGTNITPMNITTATNTNVPYTLTTTTTTNNICREFKYDGTERQN